MKRQDPLFLPRYHLLGLVQQFWSYLRTTTKKHLIIIISRDKLERLLNKEKRKAPNNITCIRLWYVRATYPSFWDKPWTVSWPWTILGEWPFWSTRHARRFLELWFGRPPLLTFGSVSDRPLCEKPSCQLCGGSQFELVVDSGWIDWAVGEHGWREH